MNGELPQGWATATLGEIAEISPRHPKGLDDSTPVTFVRMAALSESKPEFQFTEERPFGEVRKGFTHFAEGDVLFAKITPCMENGKGAVAKGLRNGLGCGTTELHVIRPLAGIDPHYVYRFLAQSSVRREAKENFTGTAGQARVPNTFIEELGIPLAPAAEQRRIVAKLELLLARVDACHRRLATIPVLVNRFRQSVLTAATTGRLTVDWRAKTRLKLDAKADLESYLATRPQRPHKEAEPTEGHETLTDELPAEWATPTMDDLFRFIDYRGKTPKKSDAGKRLISAKNIKMGYISEEPVEYVSDDFYRTWMTRGFPKRGDIFFVTEGHTMGFAALNNRTDEFALSQRTITLQPWHPIETRTFFYFIVSPLFQNLVRLNATGSAAVGIKAAKFRGLPIPFPPLAEQQEIVRRVGTLFAVADRIEARYEEGRKRVGSLAQSVLAKAFRGELVATEAELAKAEGRSFESAGELLERLKRSVQQSGRAAKTTKLNSIRLSAKSRSRARGAGLG